MHITISFNVKNHIEVSESWPIKIGNVTFSLDRKDDVVQKVCISYSGVGTEHAPKITPSTSTGIHHELIVGAGPYVGFAIRQVMSWQTVVSGLQTFDLNFDDYELTFRPENVDEEKQIPIRSFRRSARGLLDSCDFEQIGRAFCVGFANNSRVESVSHFREGRIAYEAGRFVDSYNNMFLFLETRYCDGKTKTAQQVELLSDNPIFVASLNQALSLVPSRDFSASKHLTELIDTTKSIKEKIKSIVLLRGSLRHHSLKSSQRWDPNKQDEYEFPARFLGLVVGHIVTGESIDDIYAPKTLQQFRDISIKGGYETNITASTVRLEKQPALRLDISCPTTVMSSALGLSLARETITACKKASQLPDTVKIEAIQSKTGMELFIIELGLWAFTQERKIQVDATANSIQCELEHFQPPIYVKHEFSLPIRERMIIISSAWELLESCFNWIEQKDPTTRILSLKLNLKGKREPIVRYRVGVQVCK